MLAHELRNPLAPIRNALAILKLKGVSEAQFNGALQMAERQTRHKPFHRGPAARRHPGNALIFSRTRRR